MLALVDFVTFMIWFFRYTSFLCVLITDKISVCYANLYLLFPFKMGLNGYLILIVCHVEHPHVHWYISQEFECKTDCIFLYQM